MQSLISGLGFFIRGGFLSGYRTYLVGAGIALQAFISWAVDGETTAYEFANQLPEILAGAGLMSLRAAADKILTRLKSLEDALRPPKPADPASGTRLSCSPLAVIAVCGLAVLLAGCAASPEVRWAQAQKAYNEGVKSAISYRAPCIEFGPEHPLCLIDDDTYRIVEPIRERLGSLLRQAQVAVGGGNESLFVIVMDEVDALLQTFLLYTLQEERTADVESLSHLKAAIVAYRTDTQRTLSSDAKEVAR